MRFWNWLFRRHTPRRAEPHTSPYRTAPDKLPGAPLPPPPEARTALPDPPPARPRPARASSNWGLLFGIVGLIGKLLSAVSGSSSHADTSPNHDIDTIVAAPQPAPPAPATTWDLGTEAPAWEAPQWSIPALKAAEANTPSATANATAKLSPAATSSPTLRSGLSPIIAPLR